MSQNPQDNQSYPLRLPNYRFLHQGRYHPYPTYNRQQGAVTHENDIMETTVFRLLLMSGPPLAKRRVLGYSDQPDERSRAIHSTTPRGESPSVSRLLPSHFTPSQATISTGHR